MAWMQVLLPQLAASDRRALPLAWQLFDAGSRQTHDHSFPQSKVALYVNRFYLVLQRLKRNKLFRPAQVEAAGRGS